MLRIWEFPSWVRGCARGLTMVGLVCLVSVSCGAMRTRNPATGTILVPGTNLVVDVATGKNAKLPDDPIDTGYVTFGRNDREFVFWHRHNHEKSLPPYDLCVFQSSETVEASLNAATTGRIQLPGLSRDVATDLKELRLQGKPETLPIVVPGSHSGPAPVLSRDGRYVAFYTDDGELQGENGDMLTGGTAIATRKGEIFVSLSDMWPQDWTPDGRLLLTGSPNRRPGIFTFRPGERMYTQLGPHGSAESADLSPDGQRLAYSWQGNVYVSNLDGSPKLLVSPPGTECKHPVWSPDGKWLAVNAPLPNERHRTSTSGYGVYLLAPRPSAQPVLIPLKQWDGRAAAEGSERVYWR